MVPGRALRGFWFWLQAGKQRIVARKKLPIDAHLGIFMIVVLCRCYSLFTHRLYAIRCNFSRARRRSANVLPSASSATTTVSCGTLPDALYYGGQFGMIRFGFGCKRRWPLPIFYPL